MKPATTTKLALAVSAALTALPQSASALVNLGEGQIFATASLSGTYDTEIRSRNLGQEDFITNLRTGLTYARPGRAFDFSVSAGVDIQRYLDYDEFDDENLFFDLSLNPQTEVRTSRFSVSGNLILDSRTYSDEEIGDIITTRTYGASLGVLYDPNRHYNLRVNASLNREDPDSERYFEEDRFTTGLTLDVPFKEEAFLEFGGTYAKTESDRPQAAADSDIYTAFAGASGQLSPKLDGFLRAGIQSRETSRLGDDTSPYLSAGLSWLLDESSSIDLNASRELGSTLNDRASETTQVTVTARRQLNSRLSGNLGLEYLEDSLEALGPDSRSDEEMGAFAGISYDLTRNTGLRFNVRYTDQSSDNPDFEFDRWRTSLTVNGRW